MKLKTNQNIIKVILTITVILFSSCTGKHAYYVDGFNEDKLALINIDTVFVSITKDSVKCKIGFIDVPNEEIMIKFFLAQITFDIPNDSNRIGDLFLGFNSGDSLAYLQSPNNLLENESMKGLWKWDYRQAIGFYYPINSMHFENNYLIINEAKGSHELFKQISDTTKWYVESYFDDGGTVDQRNSDFYSPFYEKNPGIWFE